MADAQARPRPGLGAYAHLGEPCLIVEGSPQVHGGHIRISIDGVQWMAHRWVWVQEHGPIPDDVLVLHHCDVSPCIRLSHLYTGDGKDNARDRATRHRGFRHPPGSGHPGARLVEAQVAELRERYEQGDSQRALAEDYGVAQMTVSKIVRRETWKHC